MTVAELTVVVVPLTVKFPVTDKLLPTVTLFGNPIVALTSVPTFVTATSTSFVVPRICKSSVNRFTS